MTVAEQITAEEAFSHESSSTLGGGSLSLRTRSWLTTRPSRDSLAKSRTTGSRGRPRLGRPGLACFY